MKTFGPHLVTALGALLAVSCSYESNEAFDCEAPVTLMMDYHDKYGTDRLAQMVQSADVYLFGADDTFIARYSYNHGQITDPAGIPLVLPRGKYHLVSWGNVGHYTTVSPVDPPVGTPLSAFSVSLLHPDQPQPTSDTLFFSQTDLRIDGARPLTLPVSLRRETCYVHVTLAGYEAGQSPYLVMDWLTNGYDFSNGSRGTQVAYRPVLTHDPLTGEYTADFAFLRPRDSDFLSLRLYDHTQSSALLSVNLNTALRKQSLSLEKDTEPELDVRFEFISGHRISVEVNDWHTITDIHVEL